MQTCPSVMAPPADADLPFRDDDARSCLCEPGEACRAQSGGPIPQSGVHCAQARPRSAALRRGCVAPRSLRAGCFGYHVVWDTPSIAGDFLQRTGDSPLYENPGEYPTRLCARRGPGLAASAAARPCHVCTATGLTVATSALGLGSRLLRLLRDWAHSIHICTGTGLTRNGAGATSATGRRAQQAAGRLRGSRLYCI